MTLIMPAQNTDNNQESNKDDQNVRKNIKMDIDTIICEEIGQFGWHQFKTVAIVLIFILLCGLKSGDYPLIIGRIPKRCFIPECENNTKQEFRPHWISFAIPISTDGSYDQCQRFAKSIRQLDKETCSYENFNRSKLVKCERFIYENHNTIVYDFDLGCDEWRRTLIGSVTSLANFISIPLTWYISDRWGCKAAFTINVFAFSLIGLSRVWSCTYISYIIIGFIWSIFSAGFYPSGYILVTELVGPKYRVFVIASAAISLSLGHSIVPIIAWIVPEWRELTILIYPPTLVIIFFWYFLTNPPRWYYNKNRYKEAEELLKAIAHMNNKDISEKVLMSLRAAAEEERKQKFFDEQRAKQEPWLPILVFQHKPVLVRCVVTPVLWFTLILVYFSLQFNSVNLYGNQYVSLTAVNVIDIPAILIAMFLINYVDRRFFIMGSFLFCAASQIAIMFAEKANYGTTLTLFLIGKLCINVVAQVIHLYSAELFPTKHKKQLLAFCSTLGRIGNLIAPLTPAFGDTIPYIMFASFCILSGLLVFLIPETRDAKLPDTMEKASQMDQANDGK